MFKSFERTIAFRYLRTRRREGFISVIAGFSILGITLGVATLIIVMSVMNGFRQELTRQILGFNGHLNVSARTPLQLSQAQQLAQQLQQISGVKQVTPIIEQQVMVMKDGLALGAIVHGMNPEDLRARAAIASNITFGALDNFKYDDQVIIGQKMAEKFGVVSGDTVTLVSPKGTATAFGTAPRMRSFKIIAIFEVGMHLYDMTNVFI